MTRRIPGLGLGFALLLGAHLASGSDLQVTCWLETDTDGVERVYCGTEPQHVCGLYAQWAVWACEHGYGEHVGSCDEAADEAVEVCGEWSP